MNRINFPGGLEENIVFLIIEVSKQLSKTRRFFRKPSKKLLAKLNERDDYIDNLKNNIQKKCYFQAFNKSFEDQVTLEQLKALDTISRNLEVIADKCINICRQIGFLKDKSLYHPKHFDPFFHELETGLSLIEDALFYNDVQTALDICRCEVRLDVLYSEFFQKVLDSLESRKDPGTNVTLLLISNYFERMGDSLLNIGEAILSSAIGQKIKVDQFQSLTESLGYVDLSQSLQDINLQSMGETQSGCRINRVTSNKAQDGRGIAIFKEGSEKKLAEEKNAIEKWETIFPGMTPKIYSYNQRGNTGSILVEHISGHTFKDIILHDSPEKVLKALESIESTISRVWNHTHYKESVNAAFMEQTLKRMDDVYAVHPEFRGMDASIGKIAITPMRLMLEEAQRLEMQFHSPFKVLIHGDFNVDNLICDPNYERVRFIDLHRSKMMDYVQDISVFLVSNLRLPVHTSPVRKKIKLVMHRFFDFSDNLASEYRDESFHIRLGLGLARNMFTSTRFILDKNYSRSFYLKSRYLLERILECKDDWKSYRVSKEVLLD